MFDLSMSKLLFLAVIALVIFGPNELPRIARQAGRMLRDLRQIAEGAKADLRAGLGPEFENFDFEDLNPKRFVQKHLMDEPADPSPNGTASSTNGVNPSAAETSANEAAMSTAGTPSGDPVAATSGTATAVEVDDRIPFDIDAT